MYGFFGQFPLVWIISVAYFCSARPNKPLCQFNAWIPLHDPQRRSALTIKPSKTTAIRTETTARLHLARSIVIDTNHVAMMETTTLPTTIDTLDRNDWMLSQLASPATLLIVALTLGILANGWIQRLLSGDQGLGSFLSDGSGFKKSNFKPAVQGDQDRAMQSDPIPWLRLPKLDFVEVAGQEQRGKENYESGRLSQLERQDVVIAKLEHLRLKMKNEVNQGSTKEAEAIRLELESVMKASGVQFFED